MKFKIPYLSLCKILLSSLLAIAAGQLLAEEGVTENTILIGQTVGFSPAQSALVNAQQQFKPCSPRPKPMTSSHSPGSKTLWKNYQTG